MAEAGMESTTCLTELILPAHANHYGTMYGANGLQMMGKAAFVAATRAARCAVVMAKADGVVFRRPVHVGAIVDIRARVVSRGRAAMTVAVDIVEDGISAPAASGAFVMVAVDAGGSPIAIPGPVEGPLPAEEVVS